MKILENRATSFIILAFVYAFAAACAIVSYTYMPFDFWLNLLFADIVATAVTFVFGAVFANASVYDPYWSVQPVVITAAFAVKAPALGAAQILPIVAIALWGARLTANWAYTFRGLTHQDWRYTMLKQTTGRWYPFVNFFGIHLMPTLIVYGCTLPAVFTLVYAPQFNAGSAVFFALSVCAVILQGAADCQMHSFRKRGGEGFIRSGLWKYSRHPNYLGEILMWWGVALACVCVLPKYWYLTAGALANTLMFVFISIPLADNHQSRKRGFASYRSQTRMLLPIKK